MNYSQKIQKIMDDRNFSMEEMAVTLNVTVRTLNDFVKKEYPREPSGAMARLIDILVGEINPLNIHIDPETIEMRCKCYDLIYTVYKNGNMTIQIDEIENPEGIITPKSMLTSIHPFIDLWRSKNHEYCFDGFEMCALDFFDNPMKWIIAQGNIGTYIEML
jgi:transcriptional regulator with XRE-family HTH domain